MDCVEGFKNMRVVTVERRGEGAGQPRSDDLALNLLPCKVVDGKEEEQ